MNERYESAKKIYAQAGSDTEAVMEKLKEIPVSFCWQGDDVGRFDHEGALSGGIQTTGSYPGKARTPKQLMDDIEKVISCTWKDQTKSSCMLCDFEEGEFADRDKLEPKHFEKWVAFAKT